MKKIKYSFKPFSFFIFSLIICNITLVCNNQDLPTDLLDKSQHPVNNNKESEDCIVDSADCNIGPCRWCDCRRCYHYCIYLTGNTPNPVYDKANSVSYSMETYLEMYA